MKHITGLWHLIITISVLLIFSLQACQTNDGNPSDQVSKRKDTLKKPTKSSSRDNLQDSISKLKARIGNNGDNPDLYLNLAKKYFKNNAYQQAESTIQKAINIDSSKAPYHYWYGRIFWQLEYPQGSIRQFKKAIADKPDYKEAYLYLGKVYFYLKKRKQSFKNLNEALRQDELLDKAYFYKGLNYREMGDTAKAISSLQTTVELNPKNTRAHLHLGNLHEDKPQKAIDYYKNALEAQETSTQALYGIAKSYQALEEFDKAIERYKKIVEVDKFHRNSNYNLGYIYFIKDEYEKAVKYFDNAIKADNKYTKAYLGKGMANKKLGNKAKAKKAFKRVTDLSPGHTLANKKLQNLN